MVRLNPSLDEVMSRVELINDEIRDNHKIIEYWMQRRYSNDPKEKQTAKYMISKSEKRIRDLRKQKVAESQLFLL